MPGIPQHPATHPAPGYSFLSDSQARQLIDAERVFEQLEEALAEARQVRGGMVWRSVGEREYLIRTSPSGSQKSLGPRSPQTQAIHDAFVARKRASEERVRGLRDALEEQRRLNRALRVGHAPAIVVGVLRALQESGVSEHFLAVGTHSLYAYEAAAGVRIEEGRLATRDIDLFYDAQSHLRFLSTMDRQQMDLLSVLRRADRSFAVLRDQRQTAANNQGFEVDIIRRPHRGRDLHPLPLASGQGKEQSEDVLWAAQVDSGDRIASANRFSQMIVASNGEMARMTTIAPAEFARIKRALSRSPSRDPRKARKDAAQAEIVVDMMLRRLLVQPARQAQEPEESQEGERAAPRG